MPLPPVVLGGHRRAGQVTLDTAVPLAVTPPGPDLPRERVVPPLSGDPVRSHLDLPTDHQASTHPGSEDHPEHGTGAVPGAGDRFGESKAVGVIGQADLPTERRLQITIQRRSVEHHRVRVTQQSGERGDRTGRPDPHSADGPRLRLHLADQPDDGVQCCAVIAGRGGNPPPNQYGALIVESHRLDLGTAEVHTYPHLVTVAGCCPRPFRRCPRPQEKDGCPYLGRRKEIVSSPGGSPDGLPEPAVFLQRRSENQVPATSIR